MFSINLRTTAESITDGLSNTLMMGEGAQGARWPARRDITDTAPVIGEVLEGLGSGEQLPFWGWIFADVNLWDVSVAGGPFGTTIMPLNQYPVLQTLVNRSHAFLALTSDACNSSAHRFPAWSPDGRISLLSSGGREFPHGRRQRPLPAAIDRLRELRAARRSVAENNPDRGNEPELDAGRSDRRVPGTLDTGRRRGGPGSMRSRPSAKAAWPGFELRRSALCSMFGAG